MAGLLCTGYAKRIGYNDSLKLEQSEHSSASYSLVKPRLTRILYLKSFHIAIRQLAQRIKISFMKFQALFSQLNQVNDLQLTCSL